ncbi:MAG: hypothetical protein JXR44_00375 [Thiotrichales bacterium]|nr:hypothetical protein [Thiotrichales bacterium]
MKTKLWIGAALVAATLSTSAQAEPTYFIGVAYTFGGEFGVTGKILTDDEQDSFSASVGATYYPYAYEKFGVDLGGTYAFDKIALGAGFDFVKNAPVISAGYADTK